MANVKFERNSSGYIALMKSGAMVSVLHEYADDIASTASDAISEDKGRPLDRAPYYAFDFKTSERAGVRVQTNNPHARLAEARYGHLQSAAGV